MTYHKTYTIPESVLPLVQCGMASGPYRRALKSLYWKFEEQAGKGWQVYAVSPPTLSKHDLGEGEELCIEIELHGLEWQLMIHAPWLNDDMPIGQPMTDKGRAENYLDSHKGGSTEQAGGSYYLVPQ